MRPEFCSRDELEEMGGDPSFLEETTSPVDEMMARDPSFTKENQEMKGYPGLSSDESNEKDWFSLGRQMALDLLQDDMKEEEATSKQPEARFELQIKDENIVLQDVMKASVQSVDQLVETILSQQEHVKKDLIDTQNDVSDMEKRLRDMRERETRLQQQYVQLGLDAKQAIERQRQVKGVFEALGLKSKVEEPPTPSISEGPYYTAMEGEAFDSGIDEVEPLGGDSFFLQADEPPKTLSPLRKTLRKSALTNELEEEETLTEEEQLLDVGGDPAFLDSFDPNEEAYDSGLLREEIEEMGGDPSFLD